MCLCVYVHVCVFVGYGRPTFTHAITHNMRGECGVLPVDDTECQHKTCYRDTRSYMFAICGIACLALCTEQLGITGLRYNTGDALALAPTKHAFFLSVIRACTVVVIL